MDFSLLTRHCVVEVCNEFARAFSALHPALYYYFSLLTRHCVVEVCNEFARAFSALHPALYNFFPEVILLLGSDFNWDIKFV